MGREATCVCRYGNGSYDVKALLESSEIVLRGALKRRLPFASMKKIHADGEMLVFESAGERYDLVLGAKAAASWLERINNPPTLAQKLGIGPSHLAFVVGSVRDDALAAALEGARTRKMSDAASMVAVVTSDAELERALVAYAPHAQALPIWIVHGKGPAAPMRDNDVRAIMRARGYIDTKISAVSERFSATRYAPPAQRSKGTRSG